MSNTILKGGLSGCLVEFVPEKWVVRKSCGPAYASRLRAQYEKQKHFRTLALQSPLGFSVPELFDAGDTAEGGFQFEMQHINDHPISLRHAVSGAVQLDNVALWALNNLQGATEYLTAERVFDKLTRTAHDILQKCGGFNGRLAAVLNRLQVYTEAIPAREYERIPKGLCHGDLTTDNMLYDGSGIWLVDFLDTFIDSPLLDIAKLRQDSRHGWCLRGTGRKLESTYLPSLDDLIRERTESQVWLPVFEVLNALRILPYAKTQADVEFALSMAETTLNDLSL